MTLPTSAMRNQPEMNLKNNTILYRCWHLRDVCWLEDYYGSIDRVFRKCKIMAGELVAMFKTPLRLS